MWKFKPEEIFRTNPRPVISVRDVPRINQRVIIVDNFYLHPQKVRRLILQSPCPIFLPSAGNFVDYYDCRLKLAINCAEPLQAIKGLVAEYYGIADIECGEVFMGNVFKLIKDQPKGADAQPHADFGRRMAALVYLNPPSQCRGGTGIYRCRTLKLDTVPADKMREGYVRLRLRKMIGGEYFVPIEPDWELLTAIAMKFNRLLIYPATLFHAAIHPRNAFRNYHRVSQVVFFP